MTALRAYITHERRGAELTPDKHHSLARQRGDGAPAAWCLACLRTLFLTLNAFFAGRLLLGHINAPDR